jgi:hypothetical protein
MRARYQANAASVAGGLLSTDNWAVIASGGTPFAVKRERNRFEALARISGSDDRALCVREIAEVLAIRTGRPLDKQASKLVVAPVRNAMPRLSDQLRRGNRTTHWLVRACATCADATCPYNKSAIAIQSTQRPR